MVKESMISKPLLALLIFTISLHQSMSMKKKIWDLWLPAIGLFRIRLLSQTRFLFARHDFQSLPLHHLIHTRAHMVWMMAEIIQLRIIMVPSSFGQLKIVKFLLNLCKWCRILLKYLPSKSLSLLDGSLQLPLLPHSRLVRNINSSLRSSILRLKSKRWQPPTTTTTPKPFSKNHQQQFKKQHSQIRKQKTTKRVHFNEHASVIVFNHLCWTTFPTPWLLNYRWLINPRYIANSTETMLSTNCEACRDTVAECSSLSVNKCTVSQPMPDWWPVASDERISSNL